MSGPLLTFNSLVQCSHAGTATPMKPNSRVLCGGEPTLTVPSSYVIAGCSLTNSTGAPFCQSGMWTAGTQRVTSGGLPLAIQGGQSTCVNTGQPLRVQQSQQKVSAT